MSLAPAALDRLRQYGFPGNVRELRNVLERAAIMADGTRLTVEHIEFALGGLRLPASAAPAAGNDRTEATMLASAPRPLKHVESELLQAALAAHRGSRKALAAQLGISERTLYRRLKGRSDNG